MVVVVKVKKIRDDIRPDHERQFARFDFPLFKFDPGIGLPSTAMSNSISVTTVHEHQAEAARAVSMRCAESTSS
jgi:hypothetical protein